MVVQGIFCEETCPEPGLKCTKEKFYRKWSNATQWANNTRDKDLTKLWDDKYNIDKKEVPGKDSDVFVPCEWNLLIDVNLLEVNSIVIEGFLTLHSSLINL